VILSSQDFKESFVSPLRVPRVCNKPIINSIFSSPTNNSYIMKSQIVAFHMLINSWFISQKVLKHLKFSFNWSFCHNFMLYTAHVSWNSIVQTCFFLVYKICLIVSTQARFLTFWSRYDCWAWAISSINMMVARRQRVRLTPFRVIVDISGDNAVVVVISKCLSRISSIASISASIAASK